MKFESGALQRDVPAPRRVDGVRLRNALLMQRGRAADFDWTPQRLPAGYAIEMRPPSAFFARVVRELRLDGLSAWEKACALSSHLTERAQDLGPIQSDLATTYRRIRRGYGHCADFSRVFLALAHAAGVFAREWAFTHNGFGGNGHVLVEVWDPLRAQWLMLDVYNNFHARDAATQQPLGALEFRRSVLGVRPAAVVCRTGKGRPGFVHEHKLLEYYRRGAAEWHMVWGNAVYSYEANPLVRAALRLHPAAGHALALLCGKHPGIRLYVTEQNRHAAEALAHLGRDARRLMWSGTAFCVAALSVTLYTVTRL